MAKITIDLDRKLGAFTAFLREQRVDHFQRPPLPSFLRLGDAGVHQQHALEADRLSDRSSEFFDRDVLPGSDIEEVVGGVVFHQKDTGIPKVIRGQEFASNLATSPDSRARFARNFGLVEASDQRRRYMTVFRMVIIAWAVKIGWHNRNKIGAVLPAVGEGERAAAPAKVGVA